MSSVYTQVPGNLNLVLRKSDSLSTLIDFDGITLSGYTARSEITSLVTGSTVAAFQTTIVNGTAGQVNISMTGSQTQSLATGSYGWRLILDAPGAAQRTPLSGVIEVSP
jgi:hypothetical protein